ncbi:MAG: ATP-binding protein [Pseudomonadota bacterium]
MKMIRRSLAAKLIVMVGSVLLLSIAIWFYYNIRYQKAQMMENIVEGTDRLTNAIRLGTHYAMMLNSRDDITQIINNIARQPEIENIRIYNKAGQIKYSNKPGEVDTITNIKAEACDICHRSDPPQAALALTERTRIFRGPGGYRLLGIISPICNDTGCATGDCHVHPEGKVILGALDLVVSLEKIDREILAAEKGILGLTAFIFFVTSSIIFVFVLHFVNQPVKRLIRSTKLIGQGQYATRVSVQQEDELGQLAETINGMGEQIGKKQEELRRQRDEYQNLFDLVPCMITVQDRNYRILRCNSAFFGVFRPEPGDLCFRAYKGRTEKCINCPVETTFADGQSHYAEETGIDKDGNPKHWLVRTSPIRDDAGDIVAAMEVSLDITPRKLLEDKLEASEKKYHAIFNNIPNPVFVLDKKTLVILDCNESVKPVYAIDGKALIGVPFPELFAPEERERYAGAIISSEVINQAKQVAAGGKTIFVNIRVSPSEYDGRHVLLVTTSDITQRLETEQQLIQASKMATLGEMATGVAHELNQPLSVIKTASSFFIKKLDTQSHLDPEILSIMLRKIDANVDRASKIISHMRLFARKSEIDLVHTNVNAVLVKAFEMFSQQLKVRGIEVVWDIAEDLPPVSADPIRLEQVFINLLLNARDAIEERLGTDAGVQEGVIRLKTRLNKEMAVIEVADNGNGIPGEMVDKVFEPFFTTKEVGKGTGLGLSISYGIIRECGGSIRATNMPGGGARFIIALPVWRSA